jgi:hypothetical protein
LAAIGLFSRATIYSGKSSLLMLIETLSFSALGNTKPKKSRLGKQTLGDFENWPA